MLAHARTHTHTYTHRHPRTHTHTHTHSHTHTHTQPLARLTMKWATAALSAATAALPFMHPKVRRLVPLRLKGCTCCKGIAGVTQASRPRLPEQAHCCKQPYCFHCILLFLQSSPARWKGWAPPAPCTPTSSAPLLLHSYDNLWRHATPHTTRTGQNSISIRFNHITYGYICREVVVLIR